MSKFKVFTMFYSFISNSESTENEELNLKNVIASFKRFEFKIFLIYIALKIFLCFEFLFFETRAD